MAFLHHKSLVFALTAAAASASVLLGAAAGPANAQSPTPCPTEKICGAFDTIPDFASRPTLTSRQSGAWNNPLTWNPARVPGPSDVVRVMNGHLVTLDGQTAQADVVGIEDGAELRLGSPSRLVITTGVVYSGGTLSSVVNASGEIVIRDKPLDLASDPRQYGNGLIVLGRLRLAGADRRPTFVRLGTEPLAGQDRLSLSAPLPTGRWQIGDKLYLAGTRQLTFPRWNSIHNPDGSWNFLPLWHSGANQNFQEYRTVRAILDNGKTVVLDRPLAYDHKGAWGVDKNNVAKTWTRLAQKHGVLSSAPTPAAQVSLHDSAQQDTWNRLFSEYSQTVEQTPLQLKRLPHVANLSRSFVVRSENPQGTRGHVLLMGRADVDVRHVQFQGMGRTGAQPLDNASVDGLGNVTHVGTNQIGRYAIHLHHVSGPTTPQASGFQYTLYGCSVIDSRKWGVALHNSHYGLVYNNVVVGWEGAGIVTEDGSETGNQILYNFAADGGTSSQNPGMTNAEDDPLSRDGARDFAWRGDGLWLASASNLVVGNVACNVRGAGVNLVAIGGKYGETRIPKWQGADPSRAGEYRSYQFTERANVPYETAFSGNEAYGCERGFETWAKTPVNIKDTYLWHNARHGFFAGHGGAFPQESQSVDGLTVIGDVRALAPVPQLVNDDRTCYGVQSTFYWTINKWTNVDIQNVRLGALISTNSGEDQNTTGIHDSDLSDWFMRNETNLVSTAEMHYKNGKLGPSRFRVKNVLFAPGLGQASLHTYTPAFDISSDKSVTQPDQLFLLGFQKMAGCDSQLFYDQQRPDRIMPGWGDQTFEGKSYFRLWGAPESGLTNQQAWAKYRVALAGAVAPSTLSRPEFPRAFVCPVTASPYPAKWDEHHYNGWVDVWSPQQIAGWAWDMDYMNTPLKLRWYVDNSLKAEFVADVLRPDLADIGQGVGKHGFSVPTPAGLSDGVTRRWSLRVYEVNSDGREREVEIGARDWNGR